MSLPTQPSDSDVEVFDQADYETLDALRNAVESAAGPCLLLVNAIDIGEVVPWLEEDERLEVCLRESPPALIEHRATGLKRDTVEEMDPLTMVASRQQFDRTLCKATVGASDDQPVSLMMCDLDRFKAINDQYGHDAGDRLLKRVAAELKRCCDHSSSIGRIGGEEFAVVCHRDARSAEMLASEIRHRISAIITQDGVSATVSIGIATTTEPIDRHHLMQLADQALYAAKASGRDCCVGYGQLEASCRTAGDDVEVVGLENQARVLADRVASFIALRSRNLINNVRQEANVDGLTQCFNRRYLDRQLADEFANARENMLAVAFLDLDHFGQVNKEHGWRTGDNLLIDVCDLIRSHIRSTDWVGRYGGEEFCVVMPNTTREDAEPILARLRSAVEGAEFRSSAGELVHMTLSIGAATADRDDEDHVVLLDRASQQALKAKQNGRNRLCFAE